MKIRRATMSFSNKHKINIVVIIAALFYLNIPDPLPKILLKTIVKNLE